MVTSDWERRAAALWEALDDYEPAAFVEAMRVLADECPADPVALFELGGAHDSTGRTPEAVGYYRRALEAGLDGVRRRRARIQMASSLRETGHPEQALELIESEQAAGSDEYDGAVAMCRALTLAKLGRDREGLSAALIALAEHLPRYRRSTVNYAKGLLEGLDAVPGGETAGGVDDRPLGLVRIAADAFGGDAVEPQTGAA